MGQYKPPLNLVITTMRKLKEMDLDRYDRNSMINMYERLVGLAQKSRVRDIF